MYNKPENQEDRPWWHTERVLAFGVKVKNFPTSELKALNEEIRGAISSLQTQLDIESVELQSVRVLEQELGPAVAFDADRFAQELQTRFQLEAEDADEIIDSYDWWKRARKAAGDLQKKNRIVQGELLRRQAYDAEQIIIDIRGKIKQAVDLLDTNEDPKTLDEVFDLIEFVRRRIGDA